MNRNAYRMTALAVILLFVILFLAGCQEKTPVPITPDLKDATESVTVTVQPTNQPTQVDGAFDTLVPPEIPGELIYIPFPVTITLDGDLSDWEGLPFSYVDRGSNLPSSPEENGSFTFSIAADLTYFYITMSMPDKNIIAGQHGTDFWNEDSMEFYLNATEDLNTRSYTPGIFQANINAADIGNADPEGLTISGVNHADHEIKGFVFKTDDGWGFEAAVPLKDLVEPKHGVEIGFQAQINGASEADRDTKLIWSLADTTDQSWNLPILFGRALFFELGRKDIPQPSVVQVLPTETPEPTPVVIPSMISVNQTGYFPAGKKMASIAFGVLQPVDWQLLNEKGEEVLSGKTTIFGNDASSGDYLHHIDFSAYTKPGSGYQLAAHGLKSVPFSISDEIYAPLKKDALAYFYHNRSGIPIEAEYVGELWSRQAGHMTDDAVTCYQGKDAAGNTWPGCDYQLNVRGGWYDAGDFGKYVVNGGISVWTLQNLYERFPAVFPDGSLNIPEQNNGIPDLLDEARWEMEFLLAMQIPDGQPQAGLVHHKMHDLAWEPMPKLPPTEVNNNSDFSEEGIGRYLYPPSTAATLNLAAAGAQCARIWESLDPAFSARCLDAAEKAWSAAVANPTLFAGNTPGAGGGNYDDTQVNDEFYWAAAELLITTGQEKYKTAVLNSELFADANSFDWQYTAPLGTISLLMVENDLPQAQLNELKENVLSFANEMLQRQAEDGYSVLIKGDYVWGSNGTILNNMILMGLAYDLSSNSQYLESLRASMDYIMGRNPVNTSYVSGYGTYPMLHPHHRFWANDPANGFPPPPAGAVSGGPNANPSDDVALNAGLMDRPPSKRYLDEIGSFSTNEVTINWNAPLAWVAVYLDQIR
jgi:endoglucanase